MPNTGYASRKENSVAPYMPVIKHTLVALGAAAAVALAAVQANGDQFRREDLIIFCQALLAGLGIGYAKRQAP